MSMSVEERIANVSNKELASSINGMIKDGCVKAIPTMECIVRAYRFDYSKTSVAEDDEILEDFFQRFVHCVTVTEAVETSSDCIISFAEKIVEKVLNERA